MGGGTPGGSPTQMPVLCRQDANPAGQEHVTRHPWEGDLREYVPTRGGAAGRGSGSWGWDLRVWGACWKEGAPHRVDSAAHTRLLLCLEKGGHRAGDEEAMSSRMERPMQ